jgi:hypothetical protein
MNWVTDPEWWQAIGTFLAIVLALSIALKDKLKSMFELKPDLKVEEIEYTLFDKTSSGELKLRVKNHGNLLATNVYCTWAIYRKDTKESIVDSTRMPFSLGIIGPDNICNRTLGVGFGLNTSEPHEIWISLKCEERTHKQKKYPLKMNISPPRSTV